jgi:hypothetical protein
MMVGFSVACIYPGDGAGVGKGRQISGVILDSYVRGRRCAGQLSWLVTLSQYERVPAQLCRNLFSSRFGLYNT